MLSQMRRRKVTYKPCPCNGICLCHGKISSFEEKLTYWLIVIFLIVELTGVIILFTLPSRKNEPQYIEVYGKTCEIVTKTDFCTSTGACSSHKIAVCKE